MPGVGREAVWRSWVGTIARRLKAFVACVLFGAVYGGVCGATYAGILTRGEGIVIGGFFGGVMGCVSGAVGCLIGGPYGWCLAGVLGAISPWIMLGVPGLELGDFDIVLAPALIGGALGIAVGRGLRKRKSRLPGVVKLATILDGARRPALVPKRPGAPTEVTPARAPEGRGDETIPAQEFAGSRSGMK
jgi:hypothetical protein